MTIRTDIVVDHELSPRIADVTSSSTEITAQDSHDTLADLEDTPEGGQFPFLVSTSGKEDLGGGTSVGLTTVLNDVQYAFQSPSPRSTGTVTNADATGITLEDSTATFQTDLVQRGDWVINFTDQSVTEVLSVTSQTVLVTRGLRNGTDNQFGSSDAYKVWEVKEVTLTGGNFTAVDSVDAAINPLFTTFGNFATITSSSSATLQGIEELEASTFIGKEGLGSTIDVVNALGNAVSGTVYPAGTRETPSDNVEDAHDINEARGFNKFYLVSSLTISRVFSHGYTWFGDNPQSVVVTLDAAGSFPYHKFQDCYIVGELTSGNIIWECIVGSITEANGFIYNSTLIGPIVVSSSPLNISKCWIAPTAVVAGVTVDMNNDASASVIVTQWEGGTVHVINMVAGAIFGIGGTAGSFTLDSSCTGGTVNYGGAIRLKSDTSTGMTYNNANTAAQAAKASKALKTGEFLALK